MLRLLWCLLCLLLAGLGNWILPRPRLRERLLRRSRLHWLVRIGLLVLLTRRPGRSCSSGCTSSATTRCGLTGEHVQVGVIAVEKRPGDGGLRVETTEIVELLQRLAKIVEVFAELVREVIACVIDCGARSQKPVSYTHLTLPTKA